MPKPRTDPFDLNRMADEFFERNPMTKTKAELTEQKKWFDVRCYFIGDGDIRKADGVIAVKAKDRYEAEAIGIEAAKGARIFSGMMFHRATVKPRRANAKA